MSDEFGKIDLAGFYGAQSQICSTAKLRWMRPSWNHVREVEMDLAKSITGLHGQYSLAWPTDQNTWIPYLNQVY